jgi:diguanylate cyclase (GGDEF)-like protein/PAS domain S-box-containing protein
LAAGSTINITDRKQAEIEQQEANQRFALFFNLNPDITLITRFSDGCVIEVNDALLQKSGLSRTDVIGKTTAELDFWSIPADRERMIAELIRSGHCDHIETLFHVKDTVPTIGSLYAAIMQLNGVPHILSTVRDISIEKQTEENLTTIKERYDFATQVGKVGTWDWNIKTNELFWNAETFRMLGYAPDTVTPTYELYLGLVHPDDRTFLNESVQAALHHKKPYSLDCRIVLNEHTTIDCHVTGKVSFDAHEQPLRMLGTIVDITERKQIEVALSASETHTRNLSNLLRLITDNVTDLIWAKDLNQHYLFTNKAMCEKLLNAQDTEEPVGKDDMFFALRERATHPDDPNWHTFGELCQNSDALTLSNGKAAQFDEYGNVKGKFLFLDVHKVPFLNEKGEVIGVVGSGRDVTQHKAVEEKLRLASMVMENSSEAMFVTDEHNLILEVNPAFTRLTGYSAEEAIGNSPKMLRSTKHDAAFYEAMKKTLKQTGHWQGEIWNRRKNGEIYAEWQTINTVYNTDGSVHRHVSLFSDITERKKSEELIWAQANFDQLTGLPNRRMFRDRLSQDLKKAHRSGLGLALLFLDLDYFKEVNDALGHDTGDALLIETARRITACVRETDTVARLGGDEFTIILTELADRPSVERIASAILKSLSHAFEIGGQVAYVSASIGITLYPDDAQSSADMLKNADQAMYVAKNAGRNRFSYFTSAMQERAMYRIQILNDLRTALAEQQLQLHYQPIVNIRTGRIHKAEALLRWFHPLRGLISPAEFIPLAEESGLIHEIGNWGFRQVVAQTLEWTRHYGSDFQISVNKSPLQLQSKFEPCAWKDHLAESGLSGKNLVIEITEGVLLDHTPTTVSELLAFRDAGIQVAIDDFGTGYSALSYLKKFDIDYVKIDQSFIHTLVSDSNDRALVEGIIMMVHKLGLKVIAEGVETQQQLDLLTQMECDYAQGFLYSKAVPPHEFEQLLKQQI